MSEKCCAFVLLGALLASVQPVRPETIDKYLQELGYGVIPLERGGNNNLYVRAVVDGRKAVLLVDTGASLLSLDKRLAAKMKTVADLGVELLDPVLETRFPPDAILIRELQLGPAKFVNQPAHPIGLKPSGIAYDGILGCDFFIRHHAIVDCGGKRLFVRSGSVAKESGKALTSSLASSGYRAARLKRADDLILTCETTINKVRAELLVDTGSVFTILDDDTANLCKMIWELTNININGIGKRGGVRLWKGTPDSLEIGAASMLYPDTSIGACEMKSWNVGEKHPGSENVHGVLGSELLGRSNALIDFDSNTLWFLPASSDKRGGRSGGDAPGR